MWYICLLWVGVNVMQRTLVSLATIAATAAASVGMMHIVENPAGWDALRPFGSLAPYELGAAMFPPALVAVLAVFMDFTKALKK